MQKESKILILKSSMKPFLNIKIKQDDIFPDGVKFQTHFFFHLGVKYETKIITLESKNKPLIYMKSNMKPNIFI